MFDSIENDQRSLPLQRDQATNPEATDLCAVKQVLCVFLLCRGVIMVSVFVRSQSLCIGMI